MNSEIRGILIIEVGEFCKGGWGGVVREVGEELGVGGVIGSKEDIYFRRKESYLCFFVERKNTF